MLWIQAHLPLCIMLLNMLTIAGVPIAANVAITQLRKRGYNTAANWIGAKAPLIAKEIHFAEDVIANPDELATLVSAATTLENAPNPANIAKMIVTVRNLANKGAS